MRHTFVTHITLDTGPCWMLEHAAEPIDFAGYDRAERDAAREAAWRARGGRRGAGL